MARLHAVFALGTSMLLVAACAQMEETTQQMTEMVPGMGVDASASAEETQPPFGGDANVAYAQALWQALEERQLVGEAAILTYPYEGTQPHGKVLEFLEDELTLGGNTGLVMVKRNYVGDQDPEELEHAVLADRMRFLDSITIMYQREDGYDADNANWYWAKYQPDGSLATNPNGMELAGRVAKGADQGCIACHQTAPGNDYIYTYDRPAQ